MNIDMNMRSYDALHQNMISNRIEEDEIYNDEAFNISTKKNKFKEVFLYEKSITFDSAKA